MPPRTKVSGLPAYYSVNWLNDTSDFSFNREKNNRMLLGNISPSLAGNTGYINRETLMPHPQEPDFQPFSETLKPVDTRGTKYSVVTYWSKKPENIIKPYIGH